VVNPATLDSRGEEKAIGDVAIVVGGRVMSRMGGVEVRVWQEAIPVLQVIVARDVPLLKDG